MRSVHGTRGIFGRTAVICTAVLLLSVAAGCDFSLSQTEDPHSLSVRVTEANVSVGAVFCAAYPAFGEEYEWIVSTDGIAGIENGMVTAEGEGTAVLSANDGNELFTSRVTVGTARIGKRSVSCENILAAGDTLTFLAEAPKREQISWETSDAGVFSLSEGENRTAVFSANAPGMCSVSVAAGEEQIAFDVLVLPPDGEDVRDERFLLWSDEFEGNTLDGSKWGFQLGVQDEYVNGGETSYGPIFWGNNEQQYYTKEGVSVSDGTLKITARRERNLPDGRKYTSSRIVTRDKGYWTYGYFEAKMKLPAYAGMWPAFWMVPQPAAGMGTGNKYGTWAANGEIDILEARGRLPYTVMSTLHYGRAGSSVSDGRTTQLETSISEWHVYGFEWREDHMAWFVDGQEVFRKQSDTWFTESRLGDDNEAAPFDEPFYLILNLAVGGNFDGGTEPGENFVSASMEVDYVRVYA